MGYILVQQSEDGTVTGWYDASPDEQKLFSCVECATVFTDKKLAKAFQRVERYWGTELTLCTVHVDDE